MHFSAAAELSDFLHLLFVFNIFSTDAISVEVLIYYRKLFCGGFSQGSSDFLSALVCLIVFYRIGCFLC